MRLPQPPASSLLLLLGGLTLFSSSASSSSYSTSHNGRGYSSYLVHAAAAVPPLNDDRSSLSTALSSTSSFSSTSSSSKTTAEDETSPPAKQQPALEPCTIASPSGPFFDLRPLTIVRPIEGKKVAKDEKTDSWHARGYDYGANFTLNICGSVVESLDHVVGIDRSQWWNISAFYRAGEQTFSLGEQSSNLTVRGRRLVLQYTNGSPCGGVSTEQVSGSALAVAEGSRRKSATISFHCDKDPLSTATSVTYVGVDPDQCAYSFEVLSKEACMTAEPAKQTVGPGAVFAIIGLIAILVYFLGGVFYQRNVAHARGWRQLPNYSMWASMGSFIKDFVIITTSSCARCLPSSRRNQRNGLSVSANGGNGTSRGRGESGGPGRRVDDENRLIDQLDEEWDD